MEDGQVRSKVPRDASPAGFLLAAACLYATWLYLFNPSLSVGPFFWCAPFALLIITLPHSLWYEPAAKALRPLWIWTLAGMVYILLIAVATVHPLEALERAFELFLFAAIVQAGYWCAAEATGLRGLFHCMILASFLTSVIWRYVPFGRLSVVNPNAIGMLSCIVLLYLILTAEKGTHPLLASATTILTGILTDARTSFAALVSALLFFFVARKTTKAVFRRMYALTLAIPVVLTFIIALMPNIMPETPINMALHSRPLIWKFALNGLPITGNGPGTWQQSIISVYDFPILPWSQLSTLLSIGGGAHSIYVQSLFDFGLVGLLLTLVLLFWVGLKFDPDGKTRVAPIFVFVAYCGFAEMTLGPLTSFNTWPCMLLWFIVGLLLGNQKAREVQNHA